MKTKILFALVFSWVISSSLVAQITPVPVLTKDSLALVALYNSMGGQAAGLNWVNGGPVSTWGDSQGEISLITTVEGDVFVQRVSGLILSQKGLTGTVSNAINQLDSLRTFFIDGNQIKSLPDALTLPILGSMGVHHNKLTKLPNLDGVKNLVNLVCAHNFLTALPSLDSLNELRILSCNGNRITQLPSLDQLYSLENLDCSDNRLTGLPSLNNLSSLQTLRFRGNRLDTLPFLFDFEQLGLVDCRENFLTFEDITPFVNNFETFEYAPQKNFRPFDYFITTGRTISLDGYRVPDALDSNNYQWVKDGGLILGNTKDWLITNTAAGDKGEYTLTTTNPEAPDLELKSIITLIVTDTIPFDTTTLIVKGPTASDPPSGVDSATNCQCLGNDSDLWLWEGIDNLIELNTIKSGSGSNVGKDTLDFNYKLEIGPLTPQFSCDLDYPRSLPATTTSQEVKVAIVGSGMAQHGDLTPYFFVLNRQTSGLPACINPNEQVAFDFLNNTKDIRVSDPHETHVGGIVSRAFPKDIDLNLIDVKIFDNGEGYLFDLICAINFAIDAGAKVINLSLGYNFRQPSLLLYEVLKKAEEHDVVVVISSGNNGEDNDNNEEGRWPGNFSSPQEVDTIQLEELSNLLVVAALDGSETSIASFSNYGEKSVHIAAPGTGTISTIVSPSGQNEYTALSGTSMAAAEVSRIASILRAYKPQANYQEIINAITQSGDPVNAEENPINGNSKVNLTEAVKRLKMVNEDEVLRQLQAVEFELAEQLPPNIQNGPHQSIDDIEIILGPSDLIYQNINFTVKEKRLRGVPQSPLPIVFEGNCKFGSKINWNGILNSGRLMDRSRNQYLIEITIDGDAVTSIMPPDIQLESPTGTGTDTDSGTGTGRN